MTMLTKPVVAVLLAAGRGRRLGERCKALVLVNGETLLLRQCAAMHAAGIRRMVVAIGAQAEAVLKVIAQCRSRFNDMTIQAVQVKAVTDDLQDSVKAALAYMTQQGFFNEPQSGALISLVDLPLLTGADISTVLQCAVSEGIHAVVPISFRGQPGHPIWVGQRLLGCLNTDADNFSLKELIAKEAERSPAAIIKMESASPGHFVDIDTAQDVADVAAQYGLKFEI